MKVAITVSSFGEADPEPINLLQDSGLEIIPNPYGRRMTEAEAAKAIENVDGIVAGLEPLNEFVLRSANRLKAISRVGIGIDNVDLEVAQELSITVLNTPDGPTEAVAEATIGNLITLLRNTVESNTDLHRGIWKKRMGVGLRDLKLLIVGFGRIGRTVSNLLKPFGVQVLVSDPYVEESSLDGERLISMEDGIAIADAISLHANSQECLLSPAEFKAMKKGVIILNAARGCLIDEQELASNLESGKVGGAWLDVFIHEPYEGPLTRFDNVLLTPHSATSTRQCRLSMELEAAKNLIEELDSRKDA